MRLLDSEGERGYAEGLRRVLGQVRDIRKALDYVLVNGPAANSDAANDRARPLGGLVWEVGAFRCAFALDPLETWARLDFLPQLSHLILSRSALDAATTARRVLDTAKPWDARLADALWLKLEDLRLQRQFEADALPDDEPRAATRYRDLESEARRLKVEPQKSSATDRMGTYAVVPRDGPINGTALVRALGSFVHAMQWSVTLTRRKRVVGDFVWVEPDVGLAMYVAAITTATVQQAVVELALYAGRTDEKPTASRADVET